MSPVIQEIFNNTQQQPQGRPSNVMFIPISANQVIKHILFIRSYICVWLIITTDTIPAKG